MLVLGAGAVYGAFRIAMAMTTSDTSALPVWGGVTVGALVLALVAARRTKVDRAKPSRRERRAEARAAKAADKAVKAGEAAAAREIGRAHV
mgnify:CR=1 FL=1